MTLYKNNTQGRLSTRQAMGLGAFLLVFFLIASVYVRIPSLVANKAAETLYAAGFETVHINKSGWNGLSHITLEGITLDRFGFEKIQKITAQTSGISFFLHGNIEGLTIDGLVLNRPFPAFAYVLQKTFLGQSAHPAVLPEGGILVRNAQITLLTQTAGPLTFQASASFSPSKEDAESPRGSGHDLKARLLCQQAALGLESAWSGHFGSDGSVDIVVDIPSGRTQIGPLQVSRFNGWSALHLGEKGYRIQTQVEAGRASFLDIPLQKLSLVGRVTPDESQVSARAGVAGWPSMRLTMDFLKSKEETQGQILFSGSPLGPLLKEREKRQIDPRTIPPALASIKDFSFKALYQPERRFSEGPLPFSFSFRSEGKSFIDGNVLFYPDELDFRGSAEGNPSFVKALRSFFALPSEANEESKILRIEK